MSNEFGERLSEALLQGAIVEVRRTCDAAQR